MDPDPLLWISDRKSGSVKKFLDQELIFYGGLVDTGGRVSKLIDKTLFSSCVTGMLLLKNFPLCVQAAARGRPLSQAAALRDPGGEPLGPPGHGHGAGRDPLFLLIRLHDSKRINCRHMDTFLNHTYNI